MIKLEHRFLASIVLVFVVFVVVVGILPSTNVVWALSSSTISDQERIGLMGRPTTMTPSRTTTTTTTIPGLGMGEIPGLPRSSNLARYYVPNQFPSEQVQQGGRFGRHFRNSNTYQAPFRVNRQAVVADHPLGWARSEDGRPSLVQGGSRKTWSNMYGSNTGAGAHEVNLSTDGRPLMAEVESWNGPGNTPARLRVYSEDGLRRPFRANVDSSYSYAGGSNTVSVRNAAPMSFPMKAGVSAVPSRMDYEMTGSGVRNKFRPTTTGRRHGTTEIQGGSLRTFTVDSDVACVEVVLESHGMPIQAVVEIWQGPGDAKQVAEVYVQDGHQHSLAALVDTPGYQGSTIAIRNVGPMTFPFMASVTPVAGKSSHDYHGNDHYYGAGGYGSNHYDNYNHNSMERYGHNSMERYGGTPRNNYGNGYRHGAPFVIH